MFDSTEDWCKVWRKTDLCFQKWQEFGKFSQAIKLLFVIVSNKNQTRGTIISDFTKRETFHLLWQSSALGGNLTMWPHFLHPTKKVFMSPLLWPRSEYTWTLNWKESLLVWFEDCLGVPYSHRQSRNIMIHTFIIANIIPTCKKLFRG